MKKVIAIIILVAMFLIGVLATRAQSANVEDYSPVFIYNGTKYAVDRTSIQYLTGGRVVFWSVSAKQSTLIFNSMEVNCLLSKARVRAILVIDSDGMFTIKKVSNWFSKADPLANRFIYVACN